MGDARSFRRQPRNGQQTFTVMSVHLNSNYAKKRGIGLVAGDFNGAAWPQTRGHSRWQSGEICQVLSSGAFTLFCHVYDGTMDSSLSVHACLLPPHVRKNVFSSFVILVLLSCSRVCLLDVSRLLGLTLRHSAPVCCCHRDSLTRWRVAFAQEDVRVASSSSSHLSFLAAMCLVISDSLRGMSLQEKWTYEGPASLVILFFTHCATYLLPLSQFSIIQSGYAWRRSKSAKYWCSGCTLKDWSRTIRTNFLEGDSLVCDFSYACAVAFKPILRLASIPLFLFF